MRRLLLTSLLIIVALPAWCLPLWELQGEASNVRLLGSIHFLRAQDYPLPEAIDQAYQAADILVTEIDLDDLNPLAAAALMRKLAIDPQGRDLAALLGRSKYRSASTELEALDIDPQAITPYEPWYAALQITQLRLQQLGFDPSYGIEARMLMLASRDGKEIRGLETLEQQLNALDSLPAPAQRLFLMQTIEEAAEIQASIDAVLVAWRAGDSQALQRELLGGLSDQPDLYENLLVRRNRNWVRQITELAGDGNQYLVIVGALHLVGPDSVLEMLRAKGVENQQLRD
jgi:uncharacterized protein YbaP (TraB family)